MLDADTKRRIDTARDILVGKVPDPKSQVEQITIALIYKFMDDIDAESEEWGGQREFFAGDFSRYSWTKLMHPGMGGHETLNLYAEAITRMPENPGIPPLFRDIFNSAYLPYRDPETLRAFLRVIDGFSYDHSERLGDAFEYLLSVLGSQGDAGQFRTPRHIIDFMVAVIDPKKDEVVLDPACGTAGFLISSYKHIMASNTGTDGQSALTPDERGRLADNFRGYDISPDMVRLSLVNMYLHGFAAPHIFEYDTLTSEDRWNEYADVILANPPFMSPKGGIRPHNRFSVKSKRSEVLFVDYMAEHLTPAGRAGIIVPEGIIFQSQNAYRQLRKMLVQECLVGVISLPSGAFQPYTGVKTSILILDKVLAKRNPHVLFSDVKQMGLSLGVRRTPIEENDLPQVLGDFHAYYEGRAISQESWLVTREHIQSNDYILTGSRYRTPPIVGRRRMVSLREVCTITKGSFSSTKTEPGQYPLILTAAQQHSSSKYQFDQPAVCVPLISSTGHGKATLHRIHFGSGQFALANLLVALQPAREDELNVRFLYHTLDARRAQIASLMRGSANVSMKPDDLAQFEIPLPPLEVQREIVAEIEEYQKVIDGARAVVENYRPRIVVDPAWPLVGLGDVCYFKRGPFGGSLRKEIFVQDGYAVYEQSHAISQDFSSFRYFINEDKYQEMKSFTVRPRDIIMSCSGTMGRTAIVPDDAPPGIINQALLRLHVTGQILTPFLKAWMDNPKFQQSIENVTFGAAIRNVPSVKTLKALRVPLPPLATQQAIVAEIETEQEQVSANVRLISRFKGKIRAAIARVWGV